MPQLDTGAPLPSYLSSLTSLFALRPDVPRKQHARQLMLRSVRPHFGRTASRIEDEEQLDGIRDGRLPLRVRPAFVVLNVLALVLLAVLGFHPRSGSLIPINDKLLHFVCFFLATGLFYFIWDIDEPARRVWIWRHMALILTWITCFVAGGIGSELVQSLLPYKTFQWGDVLANFLGSGLGLLVSFYAEKRHRLRREIERLYEPLDQELYGDEEADDGDADLDDGEDANDPWRAVRPSPRRLSASGNKKVRFSPGKAAASATAEEDPFTSSTSGATDNVAAAAAGSPSPLNKDTLFSIEDDDDDDDEASEAWKSAR